MSGSQAINSVVAETPPTAQAHPTEAAKTAVRVELDGDEIIQFSIKPSLWFIPLASLNVLAILAFIAAALAVAMRTGSLAPSATPFQVLAGLAGLRLGVATLQWASRLYVLTNRRIMRFRGVFAVDVAECRLAKISAVDLHWAWYGRLLRLGTIRMQPLQQPAALNWEDVARPQESHELVVRAVRKAQL